jgi:WD40 repeat protein
MTHPLVRIVAAALLLAAFGSDGAKRGHILAQEPAGGTTTEVLEALPRLGDAHDDLLPTGSRLRLGTTRFRHGAGVAFVAFLGDGSQLLTASHDGLLRVWDVSTGKEVRRWPLPGNSGGGSSSFSDGVIVVVNHRDSGLDNTLILLSPDGQTLATMNYDGLVHLWDTTTGSKLRQIRTKGGFSDTLAFSPDGRTLAARGGDQVIRIYDVATGQELRQLGKAPPQKDRVYFGRSRSLAFAPDGKTLASLKVEQNNNNNVAHVVFWDSETGKEIRQIKAADNNFNGLTLSYSPDHKTFMILGDNGQATFHDPTTGKELRRVENGANSYGMCARFSHDGKVLALHNADSFHVTLFDVATGKKVRTQGDARRRDRSIFYGGEVLTQTVDFSPDGRTLALVADDAAVRLWDLETGNEMTIGGGHQATVTAVAAADRDTLMTVAGDDSLRHWDLRTGQEKRQVPLPAGSANALFSPDGRWLAVGTPGNKLALWDPLAGKELHALKLGDLRFRQMPGGGGGLALSMDSKTLAVRDYDGALRLFDTATGKESGQFNVRLGPANRGDVVMVNGISPPIAFSADGAFIALVGKAIDPKADPNRVNFNRNNNIIRLWHVATGKLVREFGTHKVDMLALAFTPDGRGIAAATSDNAVTLWETLTGQERCRFEAKEQVFLGKMFGLLGGRSGNNREFNLCSLAFSADGQTLAAGGKDRTLHLWDVPTGKKLGQFNGHQGGIQRLAFLPDGVSLVSASVDSTALVWDAAEMLQREASPGMLLEDKQLESLWNELAGDNGAVAYQAVRTLGGAPDQAVPWLQARLQPTPAPDPRQIDRLIKELDSEQFQTRQKAEQDIEKLAELAESALKKVLQGKPTLEMQQRVEKLLERLVSQMTPPAELVQQCRAVEALERIGNSEARQVLEKLAKGADGHRLTREAQGSLQRLAQRQP